MRLQEVYMICKKASDSWPKLKFEEKKGPGNTSHYCLQNLDNIKATLVQLDPIICFSENIAAIRTTSIGFENTTGNIYFDSPTKNTVTTEYNRLASKVQTVTELFQSLDYPQLTDGFDIKLPPEISLSDLSKCTRELDQVFSTCPLLSKQGGSITFSAVDVGSVWLTFAVAGATVSILGMIAALVDKAIIIRSHYLTTKIQEEDLRSKGIGNQALEEVMEIYSTAGKNLLKDECAKLAREHDVTDPEDIERLQHSVRVLAEWMSKGLEIHASVQALPEVKATFPPIETQLLPKDALTLLTEGNAKNNEQSE